MLQSPSGSLDYQYKLFMFAFGGPIALNTEIENRVRKGDELQLHGRDWNAGKPRWSQPPRKPQLRILRQDGVRVLRHTMVPVSQ